MTSVVDLALLILDPSPDPTFKVVLDPDRRGKKFSVPSRAGCETLVITLALDPDL